MFIFILFLDYFLYSELMIKVFFSILYDIILFVEKDKITSNITI